MPRQFTQQEVKEIFHQAARKYSEDIERYTKSLNHLESLQFEQVIDDIVGLTDRQRMIERYRKTIAEYKEIYGNLLDLLTQIKNHQDKESARAFAEYIKSVYGHKK